VKMLRSEVEWFPRFLAICESQLKYMHERNVECEPMRQILQCSGKRGVQAVLNAYNQENFTDHIQYKLLLAQRLVAREKKYTDLLQ